MIPNQEKHNIKYNIEKQMKIYIINPNKNNTS